MEEKDYTVQGLFAKAMEDENWEADPQMREFYLAILLFVAGEYA